MGRLNAKRSGRLNSNAHAYAASALSRASASEADARDIRESGGKKSMAALLPRGWHLLQHWRWGGIWRTEGAGGREGGGGRHLLPYSVTEFRSMTTKLKMEGIHFYHYHRVEEL